MLAALPAMLRAQTPGPPPAPPARSAPLESPFRTEIPAELLSGLPASANLQSLVGVLLPEVVSDRLDSGGLSTGEAARLGAHGSSWTQTHYRLGDVNVTDPDGSGTPLFVPGVLEWQRVNVSSGLMPASVNAPGLAIQLVPRDPSPAWVRQGGGSFAPSFFAAGRTVTSPPSIQRLDSWAHVSGMVSGPLIRDRLGLVLSASATRAARFNRSDPAAVHGVESTVFGHVVFTPTARDFVRTVALAQRVRFPTPAYAALPEAAGRERDLAFLAQSSWERTNTSSSWRVYGGYAQRERRTEGGLSGPLVVERFRDGPVPELLYPAPGAAPPGVDRRIDVGGRARFRWPRATRRHAVTLGGELSAARARVGEPVDVQIGELVDGTPARLWTYSGWHTQSDWSAATVAAHVADRVVLSDRLSAEAGLRIERVAAGAEGAARDIGWVDLFPRAGLRWQPADRIALFTGFGRYGFELPLRWLAFGDPAAPSGAAFRWHGLPAARAVEPHQIGAAIGPVGPGAGADAPVVSLDAALKRPTLDEFVLGVESPWRPGMTVRLAGLARWERNLAGLVNTGVPESAYSVVTVADAGMGDIAQQLPGFNRDPATFGADRYLLTNPAEHSGRFLGLDLTVQRSTARLLLLAGATAGMFEVHPSYRGFLERENDRGIIGDAFSNPNARTHGADSRPFTERAYTLKISGVYRFPLAWQLGVAARYQDGQPFARQVVFEDFNQGAEPVRAYFNGGTRFTFTMTIDARLQKTIRVGGAGADLMVDVYNLSNRRAEVEESQADGPTWRAVTAVQPPLAVHAGLRVRF